MFCKDVSEINYKDFLCLSRRKIRVGNILFVFSQDTWIWTKQIVLLTPTRCQVLPLNQSFASKMLKLGHHFTSALHSSQNTPHRHLYQFKLHLEQVLLPWTPQILFIQEKVIALLDYFNFQNLDIQLNKYFKL